MVPNTVGNTKKRELMADPAKVAPTVASVITVTDG